MESERSTRRMPAGDSQPSLCIPDGDPSEWFTVGRSSQSRHAPRQRCAQNQDFLMRGRIVFDSPSYPPSIEDMDRQWRAGRSREERSARVEVKSTPNHNEKEQKQANDQRALFSFCEHRNPPMRQGFRLFPVALVVYHLLAKVSVVSAWIALCRAASYSFG